MEPFTLNVREAQPVGLMLNELIQNSFKHAFPGDNKGMIEVRGKLNDDKVHLEVKDNGVGMSDKDLEEGSLGMDLIDNITEQLQAEIEVKNQEGTYFSIAFPKQYS